MGYILACCGRTLSQLPFKHAKRMVALGKPSKPNASNGYRHNQLNDFHKGRKRKISA